MSATADRKKKVFLIFAIVKNDLKINNLQIVVCATQCNLMNTKMSTKKKLEKKGTIQYHAADVTGPVRTEVGYRHVLISKNSTRL